MYGFVCLFVWSLQRICIWESLVRLSPCDPPLLCLGVEHNPPPLPDPASGPLALAPLTSTSSLRAKQSPRQPRPDGQGRGCGEGPWAQRAAVDWPVPGPASAEKQTRSRGPGLGADAVSRGRERLEQRIGHVHPWLLAPPSAWGRVGALELAQAEQWSSCQPGQGGALRSGELCFSLLRGDRQEEEGLGPNARCLCPGPWHFDCSCG
nr:uncharacterized protein LOC112580450 [Bubalus bubalis]XP_025126115.1 uncharacterized protein LOC112580450 [Bubalus bubalis]